MSNKKTKTPPVRKLIPTDKRTIFPIIIPDKF